MPEFDFNATARNIRAWYAGGDTARQAAASLLIWHEYWIRRSDFRSACTQTDRNGTCVKWSRARTFAAEVNCSSSERAVLKFAADLAGDSYGMSGFGHAHRQAVADAFAAALGVTALTGKERAE
jgi:hypothetical protein